jgi:hypothetical protein
MDNKIVEKIAKLLARGDESRNDNEHERAIAMRQAHAMLARHGLEMADVTGAAELREHLGPLVRGECGLETRYVWEAGIWGQIARLNGCDIVRVGGKRAVWLIGRQVRAHAIKSLARYVVASVIREAHAQHYAINGFGQGAWQAVAVQVARILADMSRGNLNGCAVSTATALMLVDQHKLALAEVVHAKGQFWPGGLTSQRSTRTRDAAGYQAGYDYGARIGLNTQLRHHGQKRLS